ncbi:MAG: glycosyltransferase family 4 protein [Paludibacteraceae bacterium]|nr:glycosyltransferase family 4 protein [Paludibacteraceae bacterium]
MKIAIIGTRGMPGIQGGVERHCESLYPRMKDLRICVYRRKPYINEYSNVQYPNIKYIDLPSTRIKGFEAVLHTFLCSLHIALFLRPDVVHVHNIGPGMFAPLLRLFGLKVVLTYHSPNYEHQKWNFLAKKILKFSEWLSLKFCNGIIFVNKFQMQKYSAKIRQKSVSIPNGIVKKRLTDSDNYLQRFGIGTGEYILAVGRLTAEKGFEFLVEAVNKLPQVKQLVIAGACDHGDGYFKRLCDLDIYGKVVFVGFATGEDLCQLYSHARLFVLSSVNEGFPLVLLEAMNYKLPLLVSDIPATRLVALCQDDYFRCGDVDDLTEKLRQKLAQPFIRQTYDLSPYDWDKIAQQTIAVYKNI